MLDGLLARRDQADVVPFKWDECPVIQFNLPDHALEILLTKQRCFVRSGGPPRLARLLGNGLLRSRGEAHLEQRRKTQRAFQPKLLENYERVMREESARLVSSWREGIVDFHREMTSLTLHIVARTFFGSDLGNEVEATGAAVAGAIETLPPRKGWSEKWRAWKFERFVARLDRTLADMGRRSTGDLISALAEARPDPTQLRDELMTLLIAGHETTASALSWAGYLIARDPQLQARWTSALTRGIFAESLRLYPPAWILFRRATEDVEVGGYRVKRGEHALLSPYAMGRDGRFFPGPTECRPERWAKEPIPGSFFPFGLGNRRCPGETFAWQEGVVALDEIRGRFALSIAREVEAQPLFTLRPKAGALKISLQRKREALVGPPPAQNVVRPFDEFPLSPAEH